MTDEEIVRHLQQLKFVETPVQGVRNSIVQVKAHSVVVRSERTKREREIPFDDIRRSESVTRNGVIAKALADIIERLDS
jgi:hypothetical protein